MPPTRVLFTMSYINIVLKIIHIIRTCLMYHAACKVESQPFKRSWSQLTFFNFFQKIKLEKRHLWLWPIEWLKLNFNALLVDGLFVIDWLASVIFCTLYLVLRFSSFFRDFHLLLRTNWLTSLLLFLIFRPKRGDDVAWSGVRPRNPPGIVFVLHASLSLPLFASYISHIPVLIVRSLEFRVWNLEFGGKRYRARRIWCTCVILLFVNQYFFERSITGVDITSTNWGCISYFQIARN